jgi:ATP/maltotriose-dependent transcriptional regulator MalT
MLETLREYALEMLEAAGELETMRRRHVEYFVAYAEQMYPRVEGVLDADWCDRMERDHDNLRSALTWGSAVAADIEAGPRLAGALWTFWYPRGHMREGRAWTEQMLALPAGPAVRARLAGAAGMFAFLQGDSSMARTLLEEALRLWHEIGDERGAAYALARVAMVDRQQGDLGRATALVEESLATWRRLGDRQGLTGALAPAINIAHSRGDVKATLAYAEESVALNRSIDNRAQLPWSLGYLGMAALATGDLARARAAMDESRTRFLEVGDEHGLVTLNLSHAALARRQGDVSQVAALSHEGISLRRNHGTIWNAHQHIGDLAWVATVRGQPAQAARLIGAADALRRTDRRPTDPIHRDDHERLIAELRAALGDEAYEAARTDGETMTVDDLIAYAAAEASRS